jgi:hypothetical protein
MNYWEALPIRVPGRFYVPVTLQEWISPRGNASLGDDPPPCCRLCSRAMMQSRSKPETGPKGRCDGSPPAISEHGLVGGSPADGALNRKAYRRWRDSS